MPSQQAHLDTFRLSGHKLFAYASIYVGRLIVEGEITVAPTIYPIKYLVYSVNSGDPDDIRPGFRVDICTPSGRLKVRTRVRFGNVSDANVISVRELGKGSGSIEVGDLVRVYRDLRLSDKLVDNSQFFNPDGTAYSDQGQNPQPVPISGGAWAGWTRMLPALGTGSESYTLDPDSSGTVTHLWDGDGLTVDDNDAADVEFTGDAGEYLVEHTVTDDDNGKSKTAYIPYIVHDAANPPYKIEIESLPNDEQRGGSARIRFLDNVPINDVPDGAPIILWKDEYIANTRQSFGARAPGRSHILFVGYWRSEEGAFDSSTGVESLSGELISPLARLDELMGYSKVMLREASPDAWNEIKALDVKRGVVQIPMEYTTLGESGFDFIFRPSFRNEAYSGFFLEASTPIGQMRELAKSTQGRVIQDMRGRIEVQMRPELVALDDRATTLTVTLSHTKRDLRDWRYTREHFNTHNRIEVHGLIAGASSASNLPLFSQWVGEAPGEGTQQQTFERVIIPATNSQDALDKIAGRLGAAAAGEFVDADGVKHTAIELETVHRGVYDVHDFYDEVVEFNFATNKRGIDFSEHQFVLMSVNRTFGNGTYETTCRWRTCTNGLQGEPYTPADETGTLPDYPYPDWTPIPQPAPSVGDLIPGWTGQLPISGIIMSSSEAKAALMTAFDPATSTVTYADISSGLSTPNIWLRSDPWNYKRAYALQEDGLYTYADQSNPGLSWTLVANNATLFGNASRKGYGLLMSHLRRGWLMPLCGATGAAPTFDYGQSWTQVGIHGGSPSWSTSVGRTTGDVAICGHDANHLYSSVQHPSVLHQKVIYYSTNGGLNWTARGGANPSDGGGAAAGPANLEIPYKRLDGSANVDDASMEMAWVGWSTGVQARLYRTDDRGAVWDLVAAESGDNKPYPSLTGSPLHFFTHDSSYFTHVRRLNSLGNSSPYYATDGLAGTPILAQGNGTALGVCVNGWSMNPDVLVAFARAYRYSFTLDGGLTTIAPNLPSGWADGVAYVEFSLFQFQ